MTKYVFTDVAIGDGLTLYVDGNSKVTVGNGSYENPLPNALSLPHISTCPGATTECLETCYVYGLRDNAPEVYAKYCQNERVLHRVLMYDDSLLSSAFAFSHWMIDNCPDGFRWHVSGDVFSKRHAEWIVAVAKGAKNVRQWIYTRSLPFVGDLIQAPNLVVNISGDAENYKLAKKISLQTGTRMCYMSRDGAVPEDLTDNDVIFPDYSLRGRELANPTDHQWWQGLSAKHRRMVCVADFFGQSEHHRCGPCGKCLSR